MVRNKGFPKKYVESNPRKISQLYKTNNQNIKRDCRSIKFNCGEKSTNKCNYYRPGVFALRDIRRYQLNKKNFAINKRQFQMLVKDIIIDMYLHEKKFVRLQISALRALQECAEEYIVQYMREANECAHHDKRITITLKDMKLVKRIRGPNR